MADDLTPKQEKFAQKYIEWGNASEAYREAYDTENMMAKTVWEEASRTLADPKVNARVQELRNIHAERHAVTVDSLTRELDEARELALRIEQPAPAISATMGKAKIHGHLTDKAELSGPNGSPLVPNSVAITVTPELVKSLVQQVRDEF